MLNELTEFRAAYFEVVVEEHEPCKPKETVLPEGSRWIKYNPDARSGSRASGSASGVKSPERKKGKVPRAT